MEVVGEVGGGGAEDTLSLMAMAYYMLWNLLNLSYRGSTIAY